MTHLSNDGLRFAKKCHTLRCGAIYTVAEAGIEYPSDFGGNIAASQQGGAESGAVGIIDADLAVVVRAWDGLSDAVRGTILRLVETATDAAAVSAFGPTSEKG